MHFFAIFYAFFSIFYDFLRNFWRFFQFVMHFLRFFSIFYVFFGNFYRFFGIFKFLSLFFVIVLRFFMYFCDYKVSSTEKSSPVSFFWSTFSSRFVEVRSVGVGALYRRRSWELFSVLLDFVMTKNNKNRKKT